MQVRQEGKLISYCHVDTYLLSMYKADDNISEADIDIRKFKKPANERAIYYDQAFWPKALWYLPVQEE